MTEPATSSATFWVQVEASWSAWSSPPWLRGIHAATMTQRRPRQPRPGTVLVKLTVVLPKAAFVPPALEGTVTVPDGKYEVIPAQVEAGDP